MQKVVYQTIGETLYTEVLDNGLAIYVFHKPGFLKKYAFFSTCYGGADRRFMLDGEWRDTPAGIAHYLEHKMFDTPDGNALALLAANGAKPNAFTSSELTAYHFECTDKFETNLKTLLSFVSMPYFTDESVEKERGIIAQEIGMVEDNPSHAVYYNLLKGLYGSHPARDPVAGTVDSIAKITSKTLYDLHSVFYNPSNMVLCVVGDIDPASVISIAQDILPKAPGIRPQRDYGPEDNTPVTTSKTVVEMAVSQPLFMLGTRVQSEVRGEAFVLRDVVGNLALEYLAGRSSPLYSRLYESGVISADFSCGFFSGQSYAFTEFAGESSTPDKVLTEIIGEAQRAILNGIDLHRFKKVKKAFSGQAILGLDSFKILCHEQAEYLFRGACVLDRQEVLNDVSPEAVLTFIEQFLRPDQFTLSVVRPENCAVREHLSR